MRFITQSSLLTVVIGLCTGCAVFFDEPGTPLARAAHRGDVAEIRSLAAAGADVNAYDATGNTALHWAARGGHPLGPHRCKNEDAARLEVVALLLKLGANPNAPDRRSSLPGGSSGWTPLHMALHHEQFRTAARLLELGASPNIRTQQGASAMAMAADEGAPPALLELLLDKGFDPTKAAVPQTR